MSLYVDGRVPQRASGVFRSAPTEGGMELDRKVQAAPPDRYQYPSSCVVQGAGFSCLFPLAEKASHQLREAEKVNLLSMVWPLACLLLAYF
jgi:hypothetical protein